MPNNLIFPGSAEVPSWYIIDKIHLGPACNLDPVNDNILIGRYIIVKYCETEFPQDKKQLLQNSQNTSSELTEDEIVWITNYALDKDQGLLYNKDRMIYQKVYKDSALQYQEVGYATSTLSNEAIIAELWGEEKPENATTFLKYLQDYYYTKENVYSKTETYDKDEVYRKEETYSSSQTYNKEEINTIKNNLIGGEGLEIQSIDELKQYTDDEFQNIKNMLLDDNNDEAINTLEEIFDWITNDDSGAAKYIATTEQNSRKIETINQNIEQINTKLSEIDKTLLNHGNTLNNHSDRIEVLETIANGQTISKVYVDTLPDLNDGSNIVNVNAIYYVKLANSNDNDNAYDEYIITTFEQNEVTYRRWEKIGSSTLIWQDF